MGFTPQRRARHIVFDNDHQYFAGLDLRVYGVSVDEWLNFTNAESIEAFSERLIEWNWETPDGDPVPPTRDGVGSIDAADLRTLVMEWMTKVTQVHADPLAPTAETASTQFEGGIGMRPPENVEEN